MTGAIVTVPPYAPYLHEIAAHPATCGLRLNTVMPVKEPLEALLRRLADAARGKPLWVDLKGRQLRIAEPGMPPYTEVRLSHRISVKPPVTVYFQNGETSATLAEVDGDRLLFLDGPRTRDGRRRPVGPGESVNIIDPTLSIEGYLTPLDERYLEAGVRAGVHTYMASFVEGDADLNAILALDPAARLVAKIESPKGMTYVREVYQGGARLMAARGDLYIEVARPHHILDATETIIRKDPNAIAASRILESLADSYEPSCADLSDVAYLLKCGYRTLMLGDDVCLSRDSAIGALNLLQAVFQRL